MSDSVCVQEHQNCEFHRNVMEKYLVCGFKPKGADACWLWEYQWLVKEKKNQLDNRLWKYIAGLDVCVCNTVCQTIQDFASKGCIILLYIQTFFDTLATCFCVF